MEKFNVGDWVYACDYQCYGRITEIETVSQLLNTAMTSEEEAAASCSRI